MLIYKPEPPFPSHLELPAQESPPLVWKGSFEGAQPPGKEAVKARSLPALLPPLIRLLPIEQYLGLG